MKTRPATRRPLAHSILALAGAVLLGQGPSAHAVTFTWDGGGASDAFTLGANWIGDVAPASNLATTDLIFTGTVRPTPTLGAVFSARSLTVDANAGPFTFSGSTLTIGAGGITNNDPGLDQLTFNQTIALGANAPLNLNGGFTTMNTLAMGANVLTVNGNSSGLINNLTGTNGIVLNGAGFFSFSVPTPQNFDITANAGTISNIADGTTDVFNSGAVIAVGASATMILHQSLTLNGASLTRAATSGFDLDPGVTFTLQAGATYNSAASLNLQAGTVALTGAGTLLQTTNGKNIAFSSGSALSVQAGAHVDSAGPLQLAAIPGTGTLTVDGTGSTVAVGGNSIWGTQGGTAFVTISNQAAATFAGLTMGTAQTGSSAQVLVQSGADVTSGSLDLSTSGGSSALTVNGSGSTWTANGPVLLGASAITSALLKVEAGATFTTTTGTLTVQPTGQMLIDQATLTLGGGLQVAGPVQLSGNSTLNFSPNSTVAVNSGGALKTTGSWNFAVGSGLTVQVSQAGTALQSGSVLSTWGQGGSANVTFSDGALGTLGSLVLASTTAGSSATVAVQSGAQVTSGDLIIGTSGMMGNHASLSIGGTGSSWTLSATSGVTLGAVQGSQGTLTLAPGGSFATGTGGLSIQPTGALLLTGGTFGTNGDVLVNGGQLTRTSGTFSLASSRQIQVTSGGTVALGNADLALEGTSFLSIGGAGSSVTLRILDVTSSTAGINLTAGGVLNVTGANAFRLNRGVATVEGSGAQLNALAAGASYVGTNTHPAALTIRSNGAANFAQGLDLPHPNSTAATATVVVESGADLISGPLTIGGATNASTGSLTVTGAGSTLIQNGSAGISIGKASGGEGVLTASLSGSIATGSGPTLVYPTGTLAITGGSFQANGDLFVGGKLTRDGTGSLTFANGKHFGLSGLATFSSNFGVFTFSSGGMLSVAGNAALLKTLNTTLSIAGNSQLAITQGGRAEIGAGVSVGFSSSGSATVDGPGSTLAVAFDYYGGGTNHTGDLTVSNQATANITGSLFLSVNSNATSSLKVLSGGDVTAVNQLQIGTGGASSVMVSGPGSTLTLTGDGSLTTVGSFLGGPSSLSVANSGIFTSSNAGLTLNPSGTLVVAGGTALIPGPITRNGGAVVFTSGALSYLGDLSIEPNGLLGANLTLGASQRLTLSGTTAIQDFQTLTLDGGRLSTGTLTSTGTLDFKKGTLVVTGAAGLEIGNGPLGSTATLATGATLQVTHTLLVGNNAQLALQGATVQAGSLTNAGLVELTTGAVTITGSSVNQTGADLLAARPITLIGSLTNQPGARVTLIGPTGRLNGPGALLNSGLLVGEGVIAKPLTNLAGGEIRAESGQLLRFTGTNASNAGKLTLQQGTLEFTQHFTNSATGLINGRGTLNFAGGLANAGMLQFSGGLTDIFGPITQTGNGTLVVAGGAIVSLFDDFLHQGHAVQVSAGSRAVFFGQVSGTGAYTGSGGIYFEGGFSPGNSPALLTLGSAVTFSSANTLTMEIGGLSAGAGSVIVDDGYDRLVFASAENPMVTWGGTLRLDLIHNFQLAVGQSFDLFDFDPARAAGVFSAIELADILPSGVALDFSKLYTTGEIVVVVPEPMTVSLLLGGLACALKRRPRRSAKSSPIFTNFWR